MGKFALRAVTAKIAKIESITPKKGKKPSKKPSLGITRHSTTSSTANLAKKTLKLSTKNLKHPTAES